MIVGLGQDARHDPTLVGHAHAFLQAKRLNA
jgi:hypothetical protein